jgi:hypothetical protein
MNVEEANAIFVRHTEALEEETGIEINAAGYSVLTADVDYKRICDASLHLLNETVFFTELRLIHDKEKNIIYPDMSGLENVLEKAKNTRLADAPVKPKLANTNEIYNRNSSGILHSFASYNNNECDYHTHPVLHDNLEDPNYFFSVPDLIYQNSFFFFPMDYEFLAKAKTRQELEKEKEAIAERMRTSQVKGFRIRLSNTVHTIAQWWEALDHLQDAGTKAFISPIFIR